MLMSEKERMRNFLNNSFMLLQLKDEFYSGGSGSVLKNFEALKPYGVSPKVSVMVRLSDKFERLKSLVFDTANTDVSETFDDTISDAINYLLILREAFLREKQEELFETPDVEEDASEFGEDEDYEYNASEE